MISNDAYKLLKWMKEQDSWMTPSEISRNYKDFDERSLKAIADAKYLQKQLSDDASCWIKYRISDPGKAYLEGARYARQTNIREWLLFCMSAASIVISIVALLKQ